jgi:hypothetical protein
MEYIKLTSDTLFDILKSTIVTNANGTYWYQTGELHRVGAPAVEFVNGTKYWYQNGELHREDGPAIEHADGDETWYLNGVIYPNGIKQHDK